MYIITLQSSYSVVALYAAVRALRTIVIVTLSSFPVILLPSLPDKLARGSACDHQVAPTLEVKGKYIPS